MGLDFLAIDFWSHGKVALVYRDFMYIWVLFSLGKYLITPNVPNKWWLFWSFMHFCLLFIGMGIEAFAPEYKPAVRMFYNVTATGWGIAAARDVFGSTWASFDAYRDRRFRETSVGRSRVQPYASTKRGPRIAGTD